MRINIKKVNWCHFQACLFSIVLSCLGGVSKSFKLYFDWLSFRVCFRSGLRYLYDINGRVDLWGLNKLGVLSIAFIYFSVSWIVALIVSLVMMSLVFFLILKYRIASYIYFSYFRVDSITLSGLSWLLFWWLWFYSCSWTDFSRLISNLFIFFIKPSIS